MSKIIIYLSNLTHTRNGVHSTESIPLNIGYLAAYAKKCFGNDIDIELFNLHSDLNRAMKKRRPHIFGASNYIWNSNLSYHYLSYYKAKYPSIITVLGGPSFSYKLDRRKDFLAKRPAIDFYISGEGEVAFKGLIEACLKHDMDINEVKKEKLSGCHYLVQDALISNPPAKRIEDLDSIPSPYLEGLLDKFLKNGFTPIMQSNRGCPFSCAYCCSSVKYYNKVTFFSVDRFKEEIDYIVKRVKSPSVHMHDDNFGIFKQDYEICQKFKETQKKYNWPMFISAATGKNVKERIIRCVELLGSTIDFSLSVQTTSKEVLKNINRENIRLNDFWIIQKRLKELGTSSYSEFILPLPGETLKSHLEGLKTAMSLNVDAIGPYTTMLLSASPLYEEESYDRFKMLKRYRVVPRDFGKYEHVNIIEVEDVCVGTKDLSFDDYIFLRGFHFIIYFYYNGDTFKELFYYLKSIGLETYDFCYALLSHIKTSPEDVKKIFDNFITDTKNELWDSKENIYRHYKKDINFNKLLDQKEGYNLLQKYRGLILTSHFDIFLRYALKVASCLLKEMKIAHEKSVLEAISSYIINTRGEIFNIVEKDVIKELEYDVHAWKQSQFIDPIVKYKKKIRIKFSQTEKQKNTIHEYIKIYGQTEDGKGKILTRINPKILFRKISYENNKNYTSA